jgi:hypothetical protein
MDGNCMSLDFQQTKELFRLYFKSIYDAITKATTIAQSAADNYTDLQDAFDNRTVISEEYNGRQSQNVNINTTFGDDVGGLNSKEFRFLSGSTLRYDRVLPMDHSNTLEVVNLQTLINAVSAVPVDFLKKDGDAAIGNYTFGADPLAADTTVTLNEVKLMLNAGGDTAVIGLEDNAIVNRKFVEDLIAAIPGGSGGSTIEVGPNSTPDSGYATLGPYLVIAWATGPSTYFSSTYQPTVTLYTPITFDIIYNYALSTENTENASVSSDNDSWWQMQGTPTGNTFYIFGQNPGGNFSGYQRPRLIVIGKPVITPLTVTTVDKNIMMADGQTYPALAFITLKSSGGIIPITWSFLSNDYDVRFATGYTNIAQISIPSAPGALPGTSYTIIVRATDSVGAIATKTLHIIASDYAIETLVITSNDTDVEADTYPFTALFWLTSTGGEAPITWSVTDKGTLANMPTIVDGNKLSVEFPSTGDFTVTVEATDSATSPQIVTKAITYTVTTYIPPPDPPCFESDQTYILMYEVPAKLLKDIKAGDKILTIDEVCLKAKILAVRPSIVTSVTLKPITDSRDSITCKNIKATLGHPWATINDPGGNLWVRSENILESTNLIEVTKENDKYCGIITQAGITNRTSSVRVAGNLTTLASTYCVSSTPNGLWFVVHNMPIQC